MGKPGEDYVVMHRGKRAILLNGSPVRFGGTALRIARRHEREGREWGFLSYDEFMQLEFFPGDDLDRLD